MACRNQAFTQVLFAWRFRLVVKLTALHLPFTHRIQHALRQSRSIGHHLHFVQLFGSSHGLLQRNGGIQWYPQKTNIITLSLSLPLWDARKDITQNVT